VPKTQVYFDMIYLTKYLEQKNMGKYKYNVYSLNNPAAVKSFFSVKYSE